MDEWPFFIPRIRAIRPHAYVLGIAETMARPSYLACAPDWKSPLSIITEEIVFRKSLSVQILVWSGTPSVGSMQSDARPKIPQKGGSA